ncbi:hypothetical protein Tco_1141497 [Tanacetum coccineum]
MRGSSYEAMLHVQVSVNGKMKESTKNVNRKTQGMNLWKVKTMPVEGTRRDSLEEPEKKKRPGGPPKNFHNSCQGGKMGDAHLVPHVQRNLARVCPVMVRRATTKEH